MIAAIIATLALGFSIALGAAICFRHERDQARQQTFRLQAEKDGLERDHGALLARNAMRCAGQADAGPQLRLLSVGQLFEAQGLPSNVVPFRSRRRSP